MTALVIAEHDHGTLKPATLNTITAASQTRRIDNIGHRNHAGVPPVLGTKGTKGSRNLLAVAYSPNQLRELTNARAFQGPFVPLVPV